MSLHDIFCCIERRHELARHQKLSCELIGLWLTQPIVLYSPFVARTRHRYTSVKKKVTQFVRYRKPVSRTIVAGVLINVFA